MFRRKKRKEIVDLTEKVSQLTQKVNDFFSKNIELEKKIELYSMPDWELNKRISKVNKNIEELERKAMDNKSSEGEEYFPNITRAFLAKTRLHTEYEKRLTFLGELERRREKE